jgi:hypothetical protein
MNYKPDEATLVAYLYGELEADERLKVESYLQRNPSEKKRMEEWSSTRSVMAHIQEKEVIAPPIILGDDLKQVPFWKESYFRMSIGLAASLLFILVAAKFMGLSATYSEGELRIGFGKEIRRVEPAATLSEQKVAQMIQASLNNNNEAIKASWAEDRKALDAAIQKNLTANSNKIDRLMQTASAANQDQVRDFVGRMQTDNLKLMKEYMQLSASGQKQYMESLLLDFSTYLDDQRKQDLQFIQARVNKVEQNTDQFKLETEQILTSLITSNGAVNNQKRN